MQYHVHHLGQDLGRFTAGELQAARGAGQFTGVELVWCEGMTQWQPLDVVFPPPAPPVLPAPAKRPSKAVWLAVAGVAFATLLGLGIVLAAALVQHRDSAGRRTVATAPANTAPFGRGDLDDPRAEGVELAKRPVPQNTNSVTYRQDRLQARAFRERQYAEGYRLYADHRAPCDNLSKELIEAWLDHQYGTDAGTVKEWKDPEALASELVANLACNDGIALTIAAVECNEQRERIRRLERALEAYKGSRYKAYPQYYATVLLASTIHNQPERLAELDQAAVKLFGQMLTDGGLRPEDQVEVGETLIFGWASAFFSRNRDAIHELRNRGAGFDWLAAVIDGQYHVLKAWESRGGGYANSVSENGWKGFQKHLESATGAFSKAWQLKTNVALPAARMIYVTMGTGDTEEMRMWFDRALSVEIDNDEAWSAMRFALFPRWHGSLPALLALGETALNTGRFDTDVPRKLFDSVTAIETEMQLPPGRRIFGRPQVWPLLEKMYRGYIDAQTNAVNQRGWRSTFAVVAHLAGRDQVAREQLEALDWDIQKWSLAGWKTDLSLMVNEIAARTGPSADAINAADKAHAGGRLSNAADAYSALAARADLDPRTREYARLKLAMIESEKKLGRGNWVPFLPTSANDPQWIVHAGKISTPAPGTLEVTSPSNGHMLVCRMNVGTDFAIRGEWEKVSSSNDSYQAGFVFGHPDMESWNWYSFRMKQNRDDGPVATVAHGWSRPQYILNAPILPDNANVFEFRFKNNKATLILNEVTLYENVDIPEWVKVDPEQFRIGIGAFNDSNETVIRYRKLEIKRL